MMKHNFQTSSMMHPQDKLHACKDTSGVHKSFRNAFHKALLSKVSLCFLSL